MKRYVIWLREGEKKVYVQVGLNGSTIPVSSAAEATPLPNRFVASCLIKAIKPAIKKNSYSVEIGFDAL